MTDKFLNAYHFTPVDEQAVDDDGSLPIEALDREEFGREALSKGDGHAVYAPAREADGATGRLSGRLVCRLETKTPLVVGGKVVAAEDKKGPGKSYNRLEPFMLDGRPAISATSLKGLISSVAEAISGSALRVLAPTPITFRKPPGKALHAIGRLVKSSREGVNWEIEPLCPPILVANSGKTNFSIPKDLAVWKSVFPNFCAMKCYTFDYSRNFGLELEGDRQLSIERDRFGNSYVYMRTAKTFLNPEGSLDALIRDAQQNPASLHLKRTTAKDFIIAQGYKKFNEEISYERPAEAESRHVRGFLRILKGGNRNLPDDTQRKHEIFIPFPEEAEEAVARQRIAVDDLAVKRFLAIASILIAEEDSQDKKKASGDQKPPIDRRPFSPLDPLTLEHVDHIVRLSGKDEIELREGSLIFFDAGMPDGVPVATELSLSAIWRGALKLEGGGRKTIATVHDVFRGPSGSADLLPMTAGDRTRVTLAERLFGFVATDKRKDLPKAARRKRHEALAGRVRFSNATPPDGVDVDDIFIASEPDKSDGWVRLKELSSPKPPSPHFYFRTATGERPVEKSSEGLSKAIPHGRKFYLHQEPQPQPWRTAATRAEDENAETGAAHRKSLVRPIRAGQTFWFHIDFDNLSLSEYQLLCSALRPSKDYWHKLGHGKPIGLGSVSIEPVAFLEVDRRRRYAEDDLFDAPRYVLHCEGDAPDLPEAHAGRWETQGSEFAPSAVVASPENRWVGADSRFPRALHALRAIGEHHPGSDTWTPIPVRSPPLTQEAENNLLGKNAKLAEDKTFEWFAQNAKLGAAAKFLKPIGLGSLAETAIGRDSSVKTARHAASPLPNNVAAQGRGWPFKIVLVESGQLYDALLQAKVGFSNVHFASLTGAPKDALISKYERHLDRGQSPVKALYFLTSEQTATSMPRDTWYTEPAFSEAGREIVRTREQTMQVQSVVAALQKWKYKSSQ